jgi:ATP-dependent DNA helicase RecG
VNAAELSALLDRLRAEPHETEWLEFKATRHEAQAIDEYLSALANSACLLGRPRAYLVFGIQDGTHMPVGTDFDPQAEKAKGDQLLPLWLSRGLHPNVGFEVHAFLYRGTRIVLFEVHPAYDRHRSASRQRWTIWTRQPSPRRDRSSPPSFHARRPTWLAGTMRRS